MAKSIKLKDENYLDSSGITHDRVNLSFWINHNFFRHFDIEKKTDTDLNNYLTSGIYQLSTTYSNAPYTSTIFGVLIVITSRNYTWTATDQSNWVWQILLDTSGNIFIRHAINNTTFWNWKRISTSEIS